MIGLCAVGIRVERLTGRCLCRYVISGIIAAAMLIASMRVVLGAEEAATAELRRLRGGD